MLRETDEIFVKPPKIATIVEAIRQRLGQGEHLPRFPSVESIATVLERERPAITEAWLKKMTEIGSLAAAPLSAREQTEHLPEALDEILYRLRYPQPLGLMTLFSMASLQHGARRRRQGLRSTVLVEEARALQVALFRTIEERMDHYPFLFRGTRQHASPRICDHRIAVISEAMNVRAELCRCNNVALIFDRAGPDKNVPVSLAGSEREGTRIARIRAPANASRRYNSGKRKS